MIAHGLLHAGHAAWIAWHYVGRWGYGAVSGGGG